MSRQRVFINGFEWWVSPDIKTLFPTDDAISGISLNSTHVTANERTQVNNQLHYEREKEYYANKR